ncbi:hypothetical protein P153DRAFT_349549 [Dothidotthia symphoricarpi CBS 119687]|uniref:Protein kinase domain-containing protein n=1 Tax=Dothidotthia symphoricarpi CBS 119687 TaxID=1392245 RepID=A0A6A6A3L8_9PLEO|nr:uncharacterized protein P153DRAFT_349549 [Dothidotthia symphoricarpi CBS 119687]KAF2125181.1 hypothetical protein P153DRAFT_349549 [Dothidotthia symphoricarpi CBS 119687]
MQSEKRDRLLEVPAEAEQRRPSSADDHKPSMVAKRSLSPPPMSLPSVSAPDVLSLFTTNDQPPKQEREQEQTQAQAQAPTPTPQHTIGGGPDSNIPAGARQVDYGPDDSVDYLSAGEPHPHPLDIDIADADAYSEPDSHHSASQVDDTQLQEELEAKWILNLSMHFRDLSDREKFFITYAEEPTKWRRVTVSCDYRELEPESLESDLKSLHYQRDKSTRIYEAIRDSLLDIQFYDTVTNLKLQTTDGRLHVHVTEDVNEIIPYPSTSAIQHLEYKCFRENEISFDSHISGFVYKVAVGDKVFIKKEIPGPDAVDEFLYEINALLSLQDSQSVIKFEGIIVDEKNELIKGLLISYAEQGALVDMIYDYKHSDQLLWHRRERWARQIVQGLSEIHEAGFVQGDFTLSNIVINHDDDAKIIDINRRGCPVGWEPPELAKLIESGQRISIYIGVKSDLYQLGMVLWALAEQQDEPERQERPFVKTLMRHNTDIPEYFKDIIRACLNDSRSAAGLRDSVSTHRSDKEYIDPATAVGLDDISQHRRDSRSKSSFENVNMPSTEYPASSGSYILPNNHNPRGRSLDAMRGGSTTGRSDFSPYPGHRSVMSLDDSELENELASLPASRETRWEQIYVDGDFKLVQRGGAELDVHDFVTQDLKDVCITTPPDDMEASFMGIKTSEDTPLNLSMVTELQPVTPQYTQPSLLEPQHQHPPVGGASKTTFSDRVRQMAQSPTQANLLRETKHDYDHEFHVPLPATLADLEHEIALDSSVSSSCAPSQTSTSFSIFDRPERRARARSGFSTPQGFHSPLHQDSGFVETRRASFDSEQIRLSLDQSIRDLRVSMEEEKMNGSLWNKKDDTMFGERERRKTLETSISAPISPIRASTFKWPPATSEERNNIVSSHDMQQKPLEEKVSNTTIRPPGFSIPEFLHAVPRTSDGDNMSSHEYTTSTIDPYNYSRAFTHTQRHLAPTPHRRDDSSKGSDLSDYLSHEIE